MLWRTRGFCSCYSLHKRTLSPVAGKSRVVWWAAQAQNTNKHAYKMKQERAGGNCLEPGLQAQGEEPVGVSKPHIQLHSRGQGHGESQTKGRQGRREVGLAGRAGFLRARRSTGTEGGSHLAKKWKRTGAREKEPGGRLSSQSSSASVPVPEGHLAPGRASCVGGPWRRYPPSSAPARGSVEGSRLLSHRGLPVSGVHQLGSQAELLEALVAHHDDNGGGRG